MPGIPPKIQQMARKPFAITATTSASISDLGLYSPPYHIILPALPPAPELPDDEYDALFAPTPCPDIEQGTLLDQALRRTLNAGHYSRFITEGKRRYLHLLNLDSKLAINVASQELDARICGWEKSNKQGPGEGIDTQLVFEVGLEWGAKLVCCLAREVELLKNGHEVLRCWYENELLPWQCMNLSMQ